MNKEVHTTESRAAFVELAIKKPKDAANKLRIMAAMLEGARTQADSEQLLSELLFLSTRTIQRDYTNKKAGD